VATPKNQAKPQIIKKIASERRADFDMRQDGDSTGDDLFGRTKLCLFDCLIVHFGLFNFTVSTLLFLAHTYIEINAFIHF
jgi:hypothetical protein